MSWGDPPPSMRRSRPAMSWGDDFAAGDEDSVCIIEESPRGLEPMCCEDTAEADCLWDAEQAATGDHMKEDHPREATPAVATPRTSSSPGLTIITDPPVVGACVAFKKRPSPPLTSPTAIKSSLAQKKKRPAPLALPELSMAPPPTLVTGPTLSTIDLNELALENIVYEGETLYGIQAIKGKRRYMEDTYCAFTNLNGDPGEAYFGVFDGHGGRKAADFAAQHLYEYIESDDMFDTNVADAVEKAFLKVDKEFVEVAEREELRDGSTAVAAYIRNGHMWLANVGDSRAVMSKNGVAVALSEEHRPDRPSEQLRIEDRGGHVFQAGSWRVEGVLAVTRAIGDKDLKKCVTAHPHITEMQLDAGDEFLVMATDGLWDVMSNQEVIDEAKKYDSPSEAASALANEAFTRGSSDNISVLVVNTPEYVIEACGEQYDNSIECE